MTDPIVAVDLFAGAGGLSTGVAMACEEQGLKPGVDVELHAINHWEPAIETHRRNHPWANHYHAKIEELHPPDVVEPGTVTLLTGGPECTHFSTARGGKPVSEQKRASAWHVLDWIEKLRPEHILLENVPEFRAWGPIDDDGTPTRDGSIFDRWVGMLEAFGYSVVVDDAGEFGVTLNAADYGDPQSRTRLFIMASRSTRPTVPEPTHDDADPSKPDRRPAADIIDWGDLGDSLWTRDLENPRVQPLSENTMARIAEGIRRHCADHLEPLADALAEIGPDELRSLRERVVPVDQADVVAGALDEPFLVRFQSPGDRTALATPSVVKYYETSTVTSLDDPLDTITANGNHHAVSTPETFCLRQQSGGVPASIGTPLPTVASSGAISVATASTSLIKPRNGPRRGLHSNALYQADSRPLHTVTARNHDGHLVTPYLCPMYNSFTGQRPRTRTLDRPLMTVPASKSPAGLATPSILHYSHGGSVVGIDDPLPTVATERGGAFGLSSPFVTPFLVEYYGNATPNAIDDPLPTVTTRDRFALCVPEVFPLGLDVRYRMLQPDELKQAQGFPADYEIAGGTKATITAQIGNAVPVHLSKSLVSHLLADETPSLTTFGGGLSEEQDAEVPAYTEVLASND